MKFLKGFLVFILVAIIIGGVGYIGYSFLFMNHSGHNISNMTASQSTQQGQSSDAGNSAQDQQNMQGMQQNGSSQQPVNNQIGLSQANLVLQNKDNLSKSITILNEALRLMSVDPYAPSSDNSVNMGNMQMQNNNTAGTGDSGNGSTTPAQGNSTTINIYPQNSTSSTQPNSMTSSTAMQSMGTTYDADKMEQLHSGLYKISVGMALLDQLNNDLVYQAEYAGINTQDLTQYYSNQYYLTVQNKDKLNQALTYINEAANLININPYVSLNGLVYDKDRMNQLHQSVFKLATGVVSLNQLSDNFTKQTVSLANTVQAYINNSNNMNVSSMNMSTGSLGGLFGNISLSTIINLILILFVVGLIFGIFGFIASLLKSPAQKTAKKEDEVI